ncbi:MAG TPA: hypothetical protein GXZ90_06370, partial [Clostridiales bacterium]|nr:hypothetical protein [Clostridiales bacterium]
MNNTKTVKYLLVFIVFKNIIAMLSNVLRSTEFLIFGTDLIVLFNIMFLVIGSLLSIVIIFSNNIANKVKTKIIIVLIVIDIAIYIITIVNFYLVYETFNLLAVLITSIVLIFIYIDI